LTFDLLLASSTLQIITTSRDHHDHNQPAAAASSSLRQVRSSRPHLNLIGRMYLCKCAHVNAHSASSIPEQNCANQVGPHSSSSRKFCTSPLQDDAIKPNEILPLLTDDAHMLSPPALRIPRRRPSIAAEEVRNVPAEPRHPPSETTRDTRRSRHPGKLGLFVYIGAAMYMRRLLYDPYVEHFLCCT
jgi:hypothetical protein